MPRFIPLRVLPSGRLSPPWGFRCLVDIHVYPGSPWRGNGAPFAETFPAYWPSVRHLRAEEVLHFLARYLYSLMLKKT